MLRLLRGRANRERSVHSNGFVRIAHEFIHAVDEAAVDHEIVRLAGRHHVGSSRLGTELGSLRHLLEVDVVRRRTGLNEAHGIASLRRDRGRLKDELAIWSIGHFHRDLV